MPIRAVIMAPNSSLRSLRICAVRSPPAICSANAMVSRNGLRMLRIRKKAPMAMPAIRATTWAVAMVRLVARRWSNSCWAWTRMSDCMRANSRSAAT